MSRQAVLALLREREGDFVSGGEIGRRLGLSRAAVWKAVEGLRQDGYTVEARTGLGYRLEAAPDAMTEPEIRRFLEQTAVVGRRLICLESVDSTNLYARQLAMAGAADGTVVTADRQTAGRGRLGRDFQSPGGLGIYLTALLRPDLPPERLSPLTAMAGVGVCRAVERVCGLSPGLKWPNDPVLDGRKLCGNPDGAVPGGGDGPGGPCGPGHRRQCAPAAGGLRPGGPGDGHVPGPGAGQARVPARPGGGAHPGDGPALRRPAERSAGAVSGGVPPAVREPGKDRASALPPAEQRGRPRRPWISTGTSAWWCAPRTDVCGRSGPARCRSGGMYGYTE